MKCFAIFSLRIYMNSCLNHELFHVLSLALACYFFNVFEWTFFKCFYMNLKSKKSWIILKCLWKIRTVNSVMLNDELFTHRTWTLSTHLFLSSNNSNLLLGNSSNCETAIGTVNLFIKFNWPGWAQFLRVKKHMEVKNLVTSVTDPDQSPAC